MPLRTYDKKPVDDAAHDFDPAFAPSPDLGRHEINHRDAQPLEFAGGAQVKIRRIGENGQGRFALGGGADQLAEATPDAGQMRDHFDDSDYGEILGSNHRVDARCAQMRSGAAEEAGIGPAAAEFADKLGGIVIARGFSGGYQDGWRRLGQVSE